ncbi:MAG: HEAT repeat domain-containing protein [Planctomycetota bacterium]
MRRALVLLFLLAGPAAAQTLDAIAEQAAQPGWRARWAAVRALAAKAGGEELFKIRPMLLRDERAGVRAAIAWAAVLEPEIANATLLGLALRKDKQASVRFAAAYALVHHRDRRAVEALIAALETESDRRVRLRCVETLRTLTPAPCLLEAADWRAWWAKHRDDARFKPADEAPRRGEYEGLVLETRTVAAVPSKKTKRGPPPHVLVLPPFGFTRAIYGGYLQPLQQSANLTYVTLPSVQSLTGRSGYGTDVPIYPVDRLVRALDRYRATMKIESFLVLAPGASGWIAMRYAQLFPDRVQALLLLDTALDKKAYAEGLMRAARKGDRGEKFTADTLMHRNNVPFNAATLDRLQALRLERGFLDRGDFEIGRLYAHARDPQGFATVPEIRWGKRARLDVPALFVYSGAGAFAGHRDMMRITKHFPQAMVTPLAGARGMPYVETNEKLFEIVAAFLAKNGLE